MLKQRFEKIAKNSGVFCFSFLPDNNLLSEACFLNVVGHTDFPVGGGGAKCYERGSCYALNDK